MPRIEHTHSSALLILQDLGGGWTEPGRWTLGADRRGADIRMTVDTPTLSLDLEDGQGPVVLQGNRFTAVTSELAAHQVETDSGPLIVGGLQMHVVPGDGTDKIAWEQRWFVGSPEGMTTLQALQEAAPEPWTPVSWTNAAVAMLRSRYPTDRFELVEPFVIAFEAATGMSGSIDLRQAWEQCRDTPMLDQQLEFRVQSFAETRAITRATRDSIVVQLKNREYVAYIDQSGGSVVTEPFAGDVQLLYCVDTPTAIRPLSLQERDELGLSMGELRALAVRNLLGLHDRIRIAGHPGRSHLMVLCGGNYEASMVLSDEVWARIDPVLKGDPVVAVPARDMFVIADTAHPDVIERMLHTVQTLPSEAYGITQMVFTRRNGQWMPWTG